MSEKYQIQTVCKKLTTKRRSSSVVAAAASTKSHSTQDERLLRLELSRSDELPLCFQDGCVEPCGSYIGDSISTTTTTTTIIANQPSTCSTTPSLHCRRKLSRSTQKRRVREKRRGSDS